MNKEKYQEKGYDVIPSVPRPELNVIIERLQIAVNRYDSILCDTTNKLKMIKKYEEPSVLKEFAKEKKPESAESALDEINCLLSRLDELNDMAERNLLHLTRIV